MHWFERFATYAKGLIDTELPVVLAGDYNVMPTDLDVYKPERWQDDALFRPWVREDFRRLVDQGWTDAIRHLHPNEPIFTFWDYFRKAYGRNEDLQIDHLLLSPTVSPRLKSSGVDQVIRWQRSSDHTPTWIELED